MDKNLKFGIIGLGLIGGSIFKALCALKCNVCAVSKSEETLYKAKKYSANISESLDSLVDSDIIFVCTPMNMTLDILDSLESIIPSSTIVLDVCSLKGFVCNKKRPYKFIPSHPMAGTEFSGFDRSYESLFQGAKWVLTPFEYTYKQDIKVVSEVIHVLGAIPIVANAEEHDEAVALISHMPMLISQAIFKTAHGNKLALKLASSGFRDTTRLALSNVEMAEDMMNLNSENIQEAILKLYTSVGELIGNDYREQVTKIKKSREHMYQGGINIL